MSNIVALLSIRAKLPAKLNGHLHYPVADKRWSQYASGAVHPEERRWRCREAVNCCRTRKNSVSFMRLQNFYRLITGYSKGAPRSENQL